MIPGKMTGSNKERVQKAEKEEKCSHSSVSVSLSVPLFLCLQEWSHSPSLLALQTGREVEPAADTGAGASHPEGSHLQG